MMVTKDTAYKKIAELIERFEDQFASYKKAEYNETLTRRDFIDPFFKALGWDMDNENGYAESYREVIHEDKVKVGGVTKAPDYSFRLVGGKRLFFVEAKKPMVVVKDEIQPAYQVRRYGWSAKLPISIMTDFEEFAIYDCTKKPSPTDKASVGRIKYLTFREYLDEFDFLWDTFSKEKVLKGSFDKFVKSDTHKKGTATVDKEFLLSLDKWRMYLATSISLNNKQLDEEEINFVVQQTLDRIIFLRIAEDRGVEPYGNLQQTIKQGKFYNNLFDLFKDADDKYNSGLFDFKKDRISKTLEIENKIIKTVISQLYFPESPYEFSVLSVEILGSAYEQFLGKQIRIDSAHRARIEEKPEVRKAGGVYYTPQYIVDYIVKNTVGKKVEGKTPEQVSRLKILDPACGSGSFLLGAYQYLLDWHKNFYTENGKTTKSRKDSLLTPEGSLTTAEKKRILLNNIFGVDIDLNAVEVTKLSLLLKCLEGETQASISHQMSMFNERVLPTLDNNIKDGNSLIDTDFYESQLDFGEERKIKPFNWHKAFPEVFKSKIPEANKPLIHQYKKVVSQVEEIEKLIQATSSGLEEPAIKYGDFGGFDVVIGNPPYVRQELLGDQKKYFATHYKVYHGMADLYSYFIEKGIELIDDDGIYGVIVANKWMRANYGEPLRRWLKQQSIHQIIDFGDLPVFESATTYPCILIGGKPSILNSSIEVTEVKTLEFDSLEEYVLKNRTLLTKDILEDKGWNLASDTEQNLLKKLTNSGIPLGEYVKGKIYRGVLTGLNEAFVIDQEKRDQLISEDKRSAEVIKPFLAGRDIKRYQEPTSEKYLILFPKGITNKNGNRPKNAWLWLTDHYPAIAEHLKEFENKAKKRFDQGEFWWELRACDYYQEFERPKIIYPNILKRPEFILDTANWYTNQKCFIIPINDKYLLGILNSSLFHYLFEKYLPKLRGGFYEPSSVFFKNFPVRVIIDSNDVDLKNQIISSAEQIIEIYRQVKENKLESRVNQLQDKISFLETQIDKAVFKLYKLTPEETKIIESIKNKAKQE